MPFYQYGNKRLREIKRYHLIVEVCQTWNSHSNYIRKFPFCAWVVDVMQTHNGCGQAGGQAETWQPVARLSPFHRPYWCGDRESWGGRGCFSTAERMRLVCHLILLSSKGHGGEEETGGEQGWTAQHGCNTSEDHGASVTPFAVTASLGTCHPPSQRATATITLKCKQVFQCSGKPIFLLSCLSQLLECQWT